MIGYMPVVVVVVNLVAVVAVACKFCAHMTLATDRLHQRCQGCQMCQVSYVNKFRVHHTRFPPAMHMLYISVGVSHNMGSVAANDFAWSC